MSNYPPPPYPRKPRYRVQEALSEPWREVTDAELAAFGDEPDDYLPATRPPQKRLFKNQEMWADVLSVIVWAAIFLVCLHYHKGKMSTWTVLGVVWVCNLGQSMAKRMFYSFFATGNFPPAPAALVTV